MHPQRRDNITVTVGAVSGVGFLLDSRSSPLAGSNADINPPVKRWSSRVFGRFTANDHCSGYGEDIYLKGGMVGDVIEAISASGSFTCTDAVVLPDLLTV